MRFYFLRHGESEANILNVFANRDTRHYPLTETGRQQAWQAGLRLRQYPVTAIYTSDLLRCMQTAEIVSQLVGIGCQPTPALREHDAGNLEGRGDLASWQAYNRLIRDWFVHSQYDQRIDGGENLFETQERFTSFIEQVAARHSPADQVLIVAHGGLYMLGLAALFENITPDFAARNSFEYCQYVIGERQGGRWVCLEWAGESLRV